MSASKSIILGLTGGIACGKSEVAAYLETIGARQIDADAISRSLTASGGRALDAIRARFGSRVFTEDGQLDRKKLGDLVFSDGEMKRALEEIIHPMVWEETRLAMEAAQRDGVRCVVLNVPLLFESNMDALCDVIWTVEAPLSVQISRVMERGFTRERAMERIRSQMTGEERTARADRAIRTDRPVEDTREELYRAYMELTRGEA